MCLCPVSFGQRRGLFFVCAGLPYTRCPHSKNFKKQFFYEKAGNPAVIRMFYYLSKKDIKKVNGYDKLLNSENCKCYE